MGEFTHKLRAQPRMMATPTVGRLIQFIGLEIGDAEMTEQGREISRAGGVYHAPRGRRGLLKIARALSEIDESGTRPTRSLSEYIKSLIRQLPVV